MGVGDVGMNDIVVYADGLVFSGGAGDEGFFLRPGGFSGWEDGVGGDARTDLRSSGGAFDVAPRLSDRLLTLSGKCWARSPQQLRDFGLRLSGLGADGARFRVSVEQYGMLLWAWARRAPNGTKFESEPSLGYAKYQVSFWLPNPRRFGESRGSSPTTTARHELVNRGNFPAAPRFVVQGPQPSGYSIIADGKPNWQVNSAVPSGQVDVVDFSTGRIMRGSSQGTATTPVVGAVAAPRPWLVPGGGVQPWYASPTGAAGSIYGELTDTYI